MMSPHLLRGLGWLFKKLSFYYYGVLYCIRNLCLFQDHESIPPMLSFMCFCLFVLPFHISISIHLEFLCKVFVEISINWSNTIYWKEHLFLLFWWQKCHIWWQEGRFCQKLNTCVLLFYWTFMLQYHISLISKLHNESWHSVV
jgi:hypothetical protein